MKGCRGCQQSKARVTDATGALHTAIRRAARWPDIERLKARVREAQEQLAKDRELYDEHHEHDQLLITDHWTRRGKA